MAANVLVVASQTAGSQHLLDALIHRAERSPIKVTLVMPDKAEELPLLPKQQVAEAILDRLATLLSAKK